MRPEFAAPRREVVAQVLDCAPAVSRRSYADLQRQWLQRPVGKATSPSNSPRRRPGLEEHRFVDETASAMRRGPILPLIAGDKIRENVGVIGGLVEAVSQLECATAGGSESGPTVLALDLPRANGIGRPHAPPGAKPDIGAAGATDIGSRSSPRMQRGVHA